MTVFRLWSDLHLDVGKWRDEWFVGGEEQVLILAGDITEIKKFHASTAFFKKCSESFRKVVYLPGNHEFWNSYVSKWDSIQSWFDERGLHNITALLSPSVTMIDEVKVVAGTLWYDSRYMYDWPKVELFSEIRDYRYIGQITNGKWTRFLPREVFKAHTSDKNGILSNIIDGTPTLVISHHAPHPLSHDSSYGEFHHDNPFVVDVGLENIRFPVTWAHGHVHASKDYIVNNVRVVCNPRGYEDYSEVNPDFDPHLTFVV